MVLSRAFAAAKMNSWLLMRVSVPEGWLRGTAAVSQHLYSLLAALQALAAVVAMKMGWVKRSFPNLLRSVFGSLLLSSVFAGHKETKVSEYHCNFYPLITISRNFVRTVSVSTSVNPGVKSGPMLFKLHIAS